ncbi:MAG: protein translocase subunit SecD [Candidatus Dormibacteraceae bacterium]
MQLVLAWPVRLLIIALILFSVFTDGAGYFYRIVNHYPLSGSVPGLPPNFGGWQVYIHKGLDLQGGTQLTLQLTDVPKNRDLRQVQQTAIQVISRRINALGVSEPIIQAEGRDRILVQLAGVSASRAQQVIGRTARLVFTKWVKDASDPTGKGATSGSPFPGYRPQLTGLTGADVNTAAANYTGGQQGVAVAAWVVDITFNQNGSTLFGTLTQNAYNSCPGATNDCPTRHIAAWLDLTQKDITNWDKAWPKLAKPADRGGKLLSNPTITNPILGGTAEISGSFTQQSAKSLATDINSGALPATLTVLQSTDVGASLGADSVKRSLAAGLLGLIIVIVFMIAYYRIPGLLASTALVIYAGIVLMVFKVVPVTLTLAGLAGFILSVGMAVDANVLIFERFKEEMRAGRTVPAAVEASVRRAWPAIRDSNTSTIITSAILAFAGSGEVKGFAITLMIGVFISLVSSIVITHNLLAIFLTFGRFRTRSLLGADLGRA